MKQLILILTLVFSVPASAQTCNQKVDPKKVVIFVMAHPGMNELKAAREAACQRGETLVVLPEMTDQDRAIMEGSAQKIVSLGDQRNAQSAKLYDEMNAIREKLRNDEKLSKDSKRKTALVAQYQALQDKTTSIRNKFNKLIEGEEKKSEQVSKKYNFSEQHDLNPMLEEKFKKYDKDGTTVASFIVSGHNGGGSFYGDAGRLNKTSIFGLPDKHPSAKNIESLYMLGCYAAAPDEVVSWTKKMPSLKWIIGYSDAAPLTYVPKGAQYLKDMMLSEKKAEGVKNESDLKNLVNHFPSVQTNYSGGGQVCKDKINYFYTKNRAGRTFASMETDNKSGFCDEKVVKTLPSELDAYFNGTKELPKDTSSGPLRALYTAARQNATCLQKQSGFWNGDRAGLLLFFEGVKKNFVRSVQTDDVDYAIANMNNDVKHASSKMDELIKTYMGKLKGLYIPNEKNIATLTRKQLNQEMAKWDQTLGVLNNVRQYLSKTDQSNLKYVNQYHKMLKKYLWDMDPACMDFMEWHEVDAEHRAHTRCET